MPGMTSYESDQYYLSSYDTLPNSTSTRTNIIPERQTQTSRLNSNYIDPMSQTNILEAGSGPSYLGQNNINRTTVNNNSLTDPSLSSAFYIPISRSNKTLFPFDTIDPTPTPTSNKKIEGGSHKFKSYVEFPSYKNINLENDTGNNNFFLPNIFIGS
jgi:hypothetical protein